MAAPNVGDQQTRVPGPGSNLKERQIHVEKQTCLNKTLSIANAGEERPQSQVFIPVRKNRGSKADTYILLQVKF